jgi:cold shock CspA family protein
LFREKGFGFIESGKSSEDLFFHARDCEFCIEAAKAGDKILFSISTDSQDRQRVVSVSLRSGTTELQDKSTPPAQPVVGRVAAPKEAPLSAKSVQAQKTLLGNESLEGKAAHSDIADSGRRTMVSLPAAAPAASKPAAAVATTPSWADRVSAGGPCKSSQPRRHPAPAPVALRKGCIKSVFQEKGFGFISSGKDTVDLFFHARDCEFSIESAKAGDKVLFSASTDGQGRRRAVSVRLR